MKAENTIQWMLDFYTTIFPTREHVLDHLFCVVGNGFKWVDGELVDAHTDDLHQRYKMIKDVEGKAHGRLEDRWYQSRDMFQDIADRADGTFKVDSMYSHEWCPLSKGSYLYNYPEDIKPDWKEVLEECKQLLIRDGIEV